MKRTFFLPIEVHALRKATAQANAVVPQATGNANKEQIARCVLEVAAQSDTVDSVRLADEACARLGVRTLSKSFH